MSTFNFLEATTLIEEQLMKACKVMNDIYDNTKSKICNVEHINNCQGKSTSLEIHKKRKRELGGMENGKQKIMELEEIIKFKGDPAGEKFFKRGGIKILWPRNIKLKRKNNGKRRKNQNFIEIRECTRNIMNFRGI